MATLHHRTCPLCDAMCGLRIAVDGGQVRDIRGDPEDVLSRGHVCPKANALRELHEDPDRLRAPVRRTACGWEQVTWDAALDEASERLASIRRRTGPRGVALYAGNPIAHNHGALLALPALLGALGTECHFTANSQDANPKFFACMRMYGDGTSLTIPDVDRTAYMLILGANPAASHGSTMSLGDVRGRLRGIRERGGKIVLFDPRRTESAAWSDEHHFLRPGGDAVLLLALLHVMFEEGLVDQAALARRARGADRLRDLARDFPPAVVATPVGVAAATIERIAREFARAPTAVAYSRVGTSQNEFGVLANWLTEALNVVTGNFDRAGGMMFTTPAVDIGPIARLAVGNHFGRWKSRVRGLPEFLGALPSAAMREEMLTPGDGQIRALVTYAGNPVQSFPNGPALRPALEGLEYMVSIDGYLNETTRHAHLVLPPVSPLERSHFDLAFHAVAVRNTVKYSLPVLEPAPGAPDDGAILLALAARIGAHRALPRSAAGAAGRALARSVPSFDTMIDGFLRVGPHGLRLDAVKAAPHGIDLGPLVPRGTAKVRTRDGRVDLVPEECATAVPALHAWMRRQDPAQIVLIGRRHVRSNNSWMHNLPSFVKGRSRASLLVHPSDADRLGLRDGAMARVTSHVGRVDVRVERSETMMRGVVSLPHGFGHQEVADTLRVAGALEGVNLNTLTDDAWVDPVLGDSILNGIPVAITSLDDSTADPAPPV